MPGVTDTGNHCDDCTTVISLPFSVTLYDQTFTSATVGSNGIFAFGTNNNAFAGSCLPVTYRYVRDDALLPRPAHGYRRRMHRVWYLHHYHRYRS